MASDPVTAGLDLVTTVVSRIWPDASDSDKAKAAQALAALQGQLDTNKAEAASNSVFVAGWRPAIGWVCAIALFYTFIGYPLLLWVSATFAPQIKPPVLSNDGMLFELMFGMLGLGGLRTFEKVKGVAR